MQKTLIAAGMTIAVFAVAGLLLPPGVRVTVSTSIDAPQATVFALINNFERSRLWSPLLHSDPNARVVLSGPGRGVGARVTWDGTVIGTGYETIVASEPYDRVTIARDADDAQSEFSIKNPHPDLGVQPEDALTRVDWHYETNYGLNVIGRYFALFRNRVVRRDHARGLASLKELAESLPRADFGNLDIERLVIEPQPIAYLPTQSRPEPAAMSEAMRDAYFQILSVIDQRGLSESGAPLSIIRSFSGSSLQFDAGIPVSGLGEEPLQLPGPVQIGTTYAGPALRTRHVGSYRSLNMTHSKIAAYMAAHGLARNGNAWESYVSDPGKIAEAELITYIYSPIKQ